MTKTYPKWHLALALIFFVLGTAFFIYNSMARCDGRIIYGLDDAYIHLALSNCLADNGTWGFLEGEFASASSSPLWTMLLTILMFVWKGEMIPLILNILIGFITIFFLYHIYKREELKPLYALGSILAVIAFTSVYSLTMIGMEHLLHFLLMILFIYIGARALDKDEGYWVVVAFAPLLGGVRYEGLFTIIAMVLILLAKRKWKWACFTLVSGFLPAVILGLVSHVNGWPVLPAGVVSKTELSSGALPDLSRMLLQWLIATARTRDVWPALILGGIPLVLAIRQKRFRGLDFYFSLLFILTFFAHMHTSRIGWLYRYEAYLIGAGIVSFTIGFKRLIDIDFRWLRYMLFLLSFFALLLLGDRFFDNHEVLYWSSQNIYHQQYQMGRFIDENYEGSTIVINDIGAPLWMADFYPIDGAGLATKKFIMVRFTNHQEYSEEMLSYADSLDAEIAIVYSHFIPDGDWIRCGSFVIPDNRICGADSVIFLAVNPREEEKLPPNVRSFPPTLPKAVEVRH